jgi:hypothetical protein
VLSQSKAFSEQGLEYSGYFTRVKQFIIECGLKIESILTCVFQGMTEAIAPTRHLLSGKLGPDAAPVGRPRCRPIGRDGKERALPSLGAA